MNPLSLARLPTPLHPLKRLSRELGAEIWVKRDDLTGFGLSGNKVRKLQLLLADAVGKGARHILTTGGIQSNHCRATAVACRQLGLVPHLLLRGAPPQGPATANLLLGELLGAEIRWCTDEEYRHCRDALLDEWASELDDAYVIPEGGSNGLGARAFMDATSEISLRFDRVVCAVGSGGTLAGLALGASLGAVTGVAVCDDRATFRNRVAAIADEIEGVRLSEDLADWDVLEGYVGPGYAQATPEVWETIRLVARTEGLFLDPVYTGKAMTALRAEVAAGRWGGKILFWHTGGAFGLFGRGGEAR